MRFCMTHAGTAPYAIVWSTRSVLLYILCYMLFSCIANFKTLLKTSDLWGKNLFDEIYSFPASCKG